MKATTMANPTSVWDEMQHAHDAGWVDYGLFDKIVARGRELEAEVKELNAKLIHQGEESGKTVALLRAMNEVLQKERDQIAKDKASNDADYLELSQRFSALLTERDTLLFR